MVWKIGAAIAIILKQFFKGHFVQKFFSPPPPPSALITKIQLSCSHLSEIERVNICFQDISQFPLYPPPPQENKLETFKKPERLLKKFTSVQLSSWPSYVRDLTHRERYVWYYGEYRV